MNLKNYRNSLGISSIVAADVCNVPLRTYQRYESDNKYGSPLKRSAMINILKNHFSSKKESKVLEREFIKKKVSKVLSGYKKRVGYCYLFGSYAKGQPKDSSDINLLISTSVTRLVFAGIKDELEETLNKKVDLKGVSDIKNNVDLIDEIMKNGIKIYG